MRTAGIRPCHVLPVDGRLLNAPALPALMHKPVPHRVSLRRPGLGTPNEKRTALTDRDLSDTAARAYIAKDSDWTAQEMPRGDLRTGRTGCQVALQDAANTAC